MPPRLAALTTRRARIAWVSGCPSSPTEPSTTSTPGGRSARRTPRPALSVTTTSARPSSSTARTVSRPGSPGPAPTNATLQPDWHGRLAEPCSRDGRLAHGGLLLGGWAGHGTRSHIRSAAPSASSSAARSRPIRSASSSGPVGGQPHARGAVDGTDDGPQVQLGDVLALGRLRRRPPRGPSSRLPERRARCARRSRRAGWRRRRAPASRSCRSVASSAAALDRQRPLAGGGQHLERVDHLGDRVEAAEPGQAGPGEHDGVELAGRRRGASRVSTLPRTSTTSRPSPSARSWAARRGEPVPTREPAGSSPRVSPSRATSASRGSSRSGTAASRMPSAAAVGRSLSEWTARSTLAGEQRLAQRADEDAGAADLGQRGRRGVAVGRDRDELDLASGARGEGVGDQAGPGRWRAGCGGCRAAGGPSSRCLPGRRVDLEVGAGDGLDLGSGSRSNSLGSASA